MKNFKKALVSLAAAAVSAASFCAVPTASAEISGKYNTYKYVFKAEENTYIAECDAEAKYNPSNIEFYKSSNGNLGGTFSVSDARDNATQRKTSLKYRNSSPSREKGYLGYIAFKTKSEVPSFEVNSIVNDRGNTLTDENVTVTSILIGDVNQDGTVEIADATLILQHIGNPNNYQLDEDRLIAADVNFDGVVTKDDSLLIQQLDAGMINGF